MEGADGGLGRIPPMCAAGTPIRVLPTTGAAAGRGGAADGIGAGPASGRTGAVPGRTGGIVPGRIPGIRDGRIVTCDPGVGPDIGGPGMRPGMLAGTLAGGGAGGGGVATRGRGSGAAWRLLSSMLISP